MTEGDGPKPPHNFPLMRWVLVAAPLSFAAVLVFALLEMALHPAWWVAVLLGLAVYSPVVVAMRITATRMGRPSQG